jgi:hypothetical protein
VVHTMRIVSSLPLLTSLVASVWLGTSTTAFAFAPTTTRVTRGSFGQTTGLTGLLSKPSPSFLNHKSWSLYATSSSRRKTIVKEDSYDPMHFANDNENAYAVPLYARHNAKASSLASSSFEQLNEKNKDNQSSPSSAVLPLSTALTVATLSIPQQSAWAAATQIYSQGSLDPRNFDPVCPASDVFYRFLQSSTSAVVGEENFVEYGPLIAGGLLRIRLELCVVESFFKEAVGPFIQKNGVSWILPLHETVETFLAGVIFALATTFILIGSTKILTVVVTYTDLIFGFPFRVLGGFAYDRASGRPITFDIGLGPWKQRVVGPPEAEIADSIVDVRQAGAWTVVLVGISGFAKVFGQVLGVSRTVRVSDWYVPVYLRWMKTMFTH